MSLVYLTVNKITFYILYFDAFLAGYILHIQGFMFPKKSKGQKSARNHLQISKFFGTGHFRASE